jgi:uncharacterized protein (DUF488 family)
MTTVYTIGHSTNSIERFVELLQQHDITAVGDVRSAPYSRFNPQFNRETLATDLKHVGIQYVFLGKELGARSDDPSCYRDNKVQYDLLAKTDLFKKGLDRVRTGAQEHRIALMCAEKDPLDCHRTILVTRQLVQLGISVNHILPDGSIENHEKTLNRLLAMHDMGTPDFFRTTEDAVREAYKKRGEAIAYSERDFGESEEDTTRTVGFDNR